MALRCYPAQAATLRDLQRRHNMDRCEVQDAVRDFPEEVALEKVYAASPKGGHPSEQVRLLRR